MNRTPPAPHRTEQTDFPDSALRIHSSSSLPCRCDRQRIESIVGVQLPGWVLLPQALRAAVLAPKPPAQPVLTVSVAVGIGVSHGPPHRSERKGLLHSAPILSTSVKPIPRPRMADSCGWQPSFEKWSHPGKPHFLYHQL